MKLGIITFHSQLNYGGVLQCWALQIALEKLGHDVVIIDRWQDADNTALEGVYKRLGLKQWVAFIVRTFLGLGDINNWLRVRRTKKFLKQYLHLTPYHFVDWKEAPKDLGVDMLVVGSDQVWHCGDFADPRAYLLEGAPKTLAIAYAASFGMTELPKFLGAGAKGAENLASDFVYMRGLAKFKSISCRENEGVEICKRLGFDSMYVVDPTLLVWSKGGKYRTNDLKRKDLVCYFLSEQIDACIEILYGFAQRRGCRVKVFLGGTWLAPFPSSASRIKQWLKRWKARLSENVEIMDSAGPLEFFKAFQSAQWVVSDSFHALMFSIINRCNVRMIRPNSDFRQKMFARIEEFAAHASGSLVSDSVIAALDSLERGEKVEFDYDWINSRCCESEAWLKGNLK